MRKDYYCLAGSPLGMDGRKVDAMAETKPVATVWDIPTGKTLSVLNKFAAELGGSGAEVIERLDRDVFFRHQVVEFMRGKHSCSHHSNVDLHISD